MTCRTASRRKIRVSRPLACQISYRFSFFSHTNPMEKTDVIKEFCMNFLKCGVAGWCMEILFTSMESIAAGELRLMGRTSLLMFPIYGLGAFLGPLGRLLDGWLGDRGSLKLSDMFWRHGVNDMVLIFLVEYVTGFFLKSAGICPWDYTGRGLNVDGLIRLDFAPCWFGAGLLFEQITRKKTP